MKVPVIIPVFNASKFVEIAVLSALNQPEVFEVILVEDGSTDSSLSICQELSKKYPKVKLFFHNQNANKGPSLSRNLGIENASFDFIAFLDSDDWYLPNRFKMDKIIFANNPSTNIIYNKSQIKIGDKYVDFGCGFDIKMESKLKGYSSIYEFILDNDITLADTNSITFRKSLFSNIKLFDERLSLHEDTELWLRISRKDDFTSGELKKPVSIARRHDNNSITNKSRSSMIKLLVVFMNNIGLKEIYDFERKYVVYHIARAISNSIRPHLIRKIVLHGVQYLVLPIRKWFVPAFYNWGMMHYNLK